jgi:protein-L-isoaspartate(D-aspartate) O-methyltransferase
METKKGPFWLCWVLAIVLAGCAEGKKNSGPISQSDFKALREKMVATQIKTRDVRDPRVLAAMLKVERHRFVPPELQKAAYQDQPLPIGEGQTISQPYIVAFMTELLEVAGEDKVLEIGTGSGYQAAVLAELAKEVYTIEIVPSLASSAEQRLREMGYRNVYVRAGDGYLGWPEAAPFDAIIITAAPDHIPEPLLAQLKEGGRMVVPVGVGVQTLKKIVKKDGKIVSQDVAPVLFVPMTGEGIKKNSNLKMQNAK